MREFVQSGRVIIRFRCEAGLGRQFDEVRSRGVEGSLATVPNVSAGCGNRFFGGLEVDELLGRWGREEPFEGFAAALFQSEDRVRAKKESLLGLLVVGVWIGGLLVAHVPVGDLRASLTTIDVAAEAIPRSIG